MSEEVKISMPLIDEIELQRIDNFYNDIVDEYIKAYVREKEQVISQRLMKNLREENQELKKQLENCCCNRTDCTGRIKDSKQYDSLVQRVEKQQKEFISYLEEKEKEFDILGDPKNAGACKGILRKYQEITGIK